MKLLTLNVHAWLEENQVEKMDILARTIAEKQYDVVALQEVNQLMTAHPVTKDLKEDNYGLLLVEKVNQVSKSQYSLFWSNSHIGYDKYDEGIAFLTKLPVYDVDSFYCTKLQTVQSILSRKIVGITVAYEGQLIDCYSCHMNLPDCQEEDVIENLRVVVERSSHSRLKILMGDFNTDAISAPADYEAIKGVGLLDTYELAQEKDAGITVSKAIDGWNSHNAQKRIDYIFVNQQCEVLSSQVIFNGKNQAVVSDHFGLEVHVKC
ncbi:MULTISPECIES: endonuclease/exonuclease/phosphatase family protein [unclassified Streptococcus]|uniref:endonuclease/exonuclease/phosphatase family protein n=1 Tax=unclassified Streptococcus TaxID=2608887 RepID=UPI001071F98F|nr:MULTISPECIES: endonuclease/exonuclease/phosphatase family protein [unclassified Streptococcus]MBF0787978.1 endonuclease/exonuclease/phosphatase family protein [Streptococcus sp. 19428wC2_LYSM12]MCQ9211952.1 endonuclease/exonuclease/phosphatase family protein [Streptococcus sp. B01]MCQ9213281.1 endonuclease/exonuclease/phosphatase family protein [Streptococcus sp. O1]TFV04964.1 endonuclease [Streptococcus sp. LYSM12]